MCMPKALCMCRDQLILYLHRVNELNPLMPTGAFNICCPRDCVSRHNGGTSGAPLKPLRDDSALRALSTLRGLRGAPDVSPLCRETSVSRTANVGTVGKNGLNELRVCICSFDKQHMNAKSSLNVQCEWVDFRYYVRAGALLHVKTIIKWEE